MVPIFVLLRLTVDLIDVVVGGMRFVSKVAGMMVTSIVLTTNSSLVSSIIVPQMCTLHKLEAKSFNSLSAMTNGSRIFKLYI